MQQNLYPTSDLGLSAYLRLKGLPLVEVRNNKHKVFFYFDPKGQDPNLLAEEYFKDGLVSARLYDCQLKIIRDRLHQEMGR